MLGSYPPADSDLLDRIKQMADSIEYTAPEIRDERRKEIITNIRALLRERKP
jgi:hypothetical protein